MKSMDRLYAHLTPTERFKVAVAAFGRCDLSEVDRLNDSTAWRTLKVQEPAYFDRLQRLTWLSLYFSVHARNLQITVLAAFSAMMTRLLQSDGKTNEGQATEEDDAESGELGELFEQRISRLKSLHAAWVEFCSGLGISASDVDKMVGAPFLGGLGELELFQGVVGEVLPDEQYQRECLDSMRTFWKAKLEERYAAFR